MSVIRQMLLFLLAVSLALFVAWAALNGWVSRKHRLAEELVHEAATTAPVSSDRLQSGLNSIDLALRFFPNRSQYLDTRGLLLEYSADLPGVAGVERRRLLEQAAGQYRQAIGRRPLWPYSWANLLGVKHKLEQVDDEFLLAFERCHTLGPWEAPVQLLLIRTALLNWLALGEGQRVQTVQAIEHAMQRQPREVFTLVRSLNRMELLCPHKAKYPRIQGYCG